MTLEERTGRARWLLIKGNAASAKGSCAVLPNVLLVPGRALQHGHVVVHLMQKRVTAYSCHPYG